MPLITHHCHCYLSHHTPLHSHLACLPLDLYRRGASVGEPHTLACTALQRGYLSCTEVRMQFESQHVWGCARPVA